MFVKKRKDSERGEYFEISEISPFSLSDTLECGQAFRYEPIEKTEEYVEYLIITGENLFTVRQNADGSLHIFGVSEETLYSDIIPYLSLDVDYAAIKEEILSLTDSEKLILAAEAGGGIRILRQDAWEALFSFIISQNNNIPRIRKIIRKISAEYGKNLALGLKKCPKNEEVTPCDGVCSECGICYTFPTASAVLENPDGLLPSKPGFRYKYLMDAAEKVVSGEIDLEKIKAQESAAETVESLKKIKGVGDKVASCVALFGFSRLDAFPVDVWIKRANEVYFDGKLAPESLGRYAGIAQQYIFHYIRNLEKSLENDYNS